MATDKAWDVRNMHPVPHDNAYYLKCMGGGAISCGVTHTAICPLDVVKCRMQVQPELYKSARSGLATLYRSHGLGSRGLYLGWLPTMFGYATQGVFKFGLYEFFKDFYMNLAGEELAMKNQGLIWLGASATAEFFADIGLCPFEMVKVRVQTAKTGSFPTRMLPAMGLMKGDPSSGFPFKSLVPLWSRQIPYTMAKFFFFEKIVRLFYEYVFTEPKESYSKSTQLGITFASGYIAGIICAIVSHPADVLVSQRGREANRGKSLGQIASEFGYLNLFRAGLGTRIIMIGTLTGLQWWIYDTYKTAFGLGTSGGNPSSSKATK